MAFLIHNLPPVNVFVRKEYLYDLEKGHGEYTPGIWVSVKSTMSKALYFETLLTDYGALFDKLPISAFVWKIEDHGNLPLDVLQLWDCFDYNLTVLEKPLLSNCEFFGKDKNMHPGEYLFTIDNCHSERSTLDQNFSELYGEERINIPTEDELSEILNEDPNIKLVIQSIGYQDLELTKYTNDFLIDM